MNKPTNRENKINKSYKIEEELYLKIQKVFARKNMKIGTYIRNCLLDFYTKEKNEDE